MNSRDSAPEHVIILVHGIRDFALWQASIRSALEKEGFKVEMINYGYFNLLEFLAPFAYFRRKAAERVWNQIRIIQKNNKTAQLSVLAHSFGTFVIAHLMQQKFDIKFHRVIFCGSVVNYGFPFEQFQDRFTKPIINEVGTRDIWPALAESITWGYGSSGTYGFRRPLVHDRWHNKAGHGYFLNPEFCAKYWLPFLERREIISDSPAPEPPRFWIQVLSIFHLKYMMALAIIGGLVAYQAGPLSFRFQNLLPWFSSDHLQPTPYGVVDGVTVEISETRRRLIQGKDAIDLEYKVTAGPDGFSFDPAQFVSLLYGGMTCKPASALGPGEAKLGPRGGPAPYLVTFILPTGSSLQQDRCHPYQSGPVSSIIFRFGYNGALYLLPKWKN